MFQKRWFTKKLFVKKLKFVHTLALDVHNEFSFIGLIIIALLQLIFDFYVHATNKALEWFH